MVFLILSLDGDMRPGEAAALLPLEFQLDRQAKRIKAEAGIDAVLQAPEAGWREAAETIGTTDTFGKGASATAVLA